MPAKQVAIDVTALKKNIGENIEQARLQKKKSIKEMALLLNLTHTGYRNIERGKTEITISKIFQIASFLDVSHYQILDFENNILSIINDNAANKQIIEILRTTLQHYKEEIAFLRKQLDLVNTTESVSFKKLKSTG